MRFDGMAFAVSAALALAGCNRASEPTTSLVGATKLLSSKDLHKETIIIARRGGTDVLYIEIRPTNEVVASSYRRDDRTRPVAQETLQISPAQADRVRRML